MPRESRASRSSRAAAIYERLDAALPDARIALEYPNELQLLVSVILSAQCTDAVVNQVTPALFARYRDAGAYARATPEELGEHIRRVGLWRAKARAIQAAMTTIAEEHHGQLPRTREELEALPGVGHKTAGVVLIHAFGTPAFPVDTHVGRVARRLAMTRETDPDKVEEDLRALYPPERWGRGHQLFIWHGRRACKAPIPLCGTCPVEHLCPKVGVTSQPSRANARAVPRPQGARPRTRAATATRRPGRARARP